MRAWVVLWAAQLRGLSRKRLWAVILVLGALNAAIVLYAVAVVPLVRIFPLCRIGDPLEYDSERRAIEESLANAFFDAFERRFPIRMVRYEPDGRRLYVTLAEALDRRNIEKQSGLAINDLLIDRLGLAGHEDWRKWRARLPDLRYFEGPNCDAMRKFATWEGEWSRAGPELLR